MYRKYIVYTCLFWIMIIGLSFIWNITSDEKNHRRTVHESAQVLFHQIVITRAWNAGHGGVYVPVTEKTQPNLYLKDKQRDLITKSGLKLTKINPAFMTRQIAEIEETEKGVKFHITSLNPIRPANKANEWESTALNKFEEGTSEYGEFVKESAGLTYRYMAPLYTKKICLICHAEQGYELGDIRGGISITIPNIKIPDHGPLAISHLIFAASGIVIIIFFGGRVQRFQANLVQARTEAEAASRTKSRFLANLSHEIRTPLNAILGFTDILLGNTCSEKQQNNLSIIKTSGKTLMEILNDILDFSRIESGKMELEYGSVNIKNLLNEIQAIFSLKTSEKKLEFITEIAPDFPTDLLLDRVKIKQVLINLVGNAVKFTGNGYVKLSAEIISRENTTSRFDLVFRVEDSGIGISENQHELIFEPFTQQEGQSQTEYIGAGLGLSISRKIIRAMGGDIKVSSSQGEGSAFTVTIKNVQIVSIAGGKDETEKLNESDEEILNGKKILVVDDNFFNREIIKQHLKISGLLLYEAENGKEAVELAITSQPELIIIDLNMPVMSGYEAIEIIRKDEKLKDTLVILLSASTFPENEKKILDAFTLFLKKPVTGNLLRSTIVNMLVKANRKKNEPYADTDENILNHDIINEKHAIKNELNEIGELIKTLEGEMFSKWEGLNKGIIVKQGIAFSREITRLGQEYNRILVVKWGKKLEMYLKTLDFNRARETIGKYPVLIESLKRQAAGKS